MSLHAVIRMIQVVGIIIPLIGVVELIRRDPVRQSMFLLMANIGCLIQNNVYLLSMGAKTSEEVISLQKIQFLGGIIFYFFLTIFILSFLGIVTTHPAEILIGVWIAIDLGFLVLDWTGDISNWLFSSISVHYNDTFGIMVIDQELAPYMILRYVFIGLSLTGLLIYSHYRLWRTQSKRIRQKLAMLIGAQLIVLLSYVLVVVFPLEYNIIPFFGSVSVLAIIFSIVQGKFFSVTDRGRDWVVDHAEDLFLITDNAYGFLDANPTAYTHLPELSKIKKNDRLSDSVLTLLNADAPEEMTLGDRIFSRTLYTIEQNEETEGYALYLKDETQINRLLSELEVERDRADEANRAKSTFLSNMSHEIRTPINAVLGMDEMILRESEEEDVLNYAENIRTAGSTLLGLINDILDFSKIEARRWRSFRWIIRRHLS
ncbi:MAG: hypothetical protein IJ679_05080 [Lachnospiraceae bacterium]|nr:hypothetical protein [Lachnospiraceae bacterium]